jgi:hypothetical protein
MTMTISKMTDFAIVMLLFRDFKGNRRGNNVLFVCVGLLFEHKTDEMDIKIVLKNSQKRQKNRRFYVCSYVH